jgi:hypothetical protein
MRQALLLLPLLTACAQPYEDLAKLDFSEVAYESEHVASDDAVIQAVDTAVTCPDGESARVFFAFRSSLQGPVPAALVLHSGAFDYIVQPDEDDPVAGLHYRADSRLSRQWGIAKVWETLGLSRFPVDPEEGSEGTLIAALVDAGVVVVLPSNCWGDLWHRADVATGDSVDDLGPEGFLRQGGAFAQLMMDAIYDPETAADAGVRVPLEINLDEVHLVGLGTGGRGVADLLHSEANAGRAPRSVVLDSTPDLVAPYLADRLQWGPEVDGMQTIYGDALSTWDAEGSVSALAAAGALPDRTAVLWSSLDTQVPVAAVLPTGLAVAGLGGSQVAVDVLQEGTVASNRDHGLAADTVLYMAEGATAE